MSGTDQIKSGRSESKEGNGQQRSNLPGILPNNSGNGGTCSESRWCGFLSNGLNGIAGSLGSELSKAQSESASFMATGCDGCDVYRRPRRRHLHPISSSIAACAHGMLGLWLVLAVVPFTSVIINQLPMYLAARNRHTHFGVIVHRRGSPNK